MASATQQKAEAGEPPRSTKISKKEQIISLYFSGMTEIEDLALITASRPSYVGSILQEAGLKPGYFDLYTSSAHPMNVYSKFFAKRLGFKDEEIARQSVDVIDNLHRQFALAGDRAGQHHALMMALVMFDRARWTGKGPEAGIFREWLMARLEEADLTRAEDDEPNATEAQDADALPSLD
ncbi:MAG: hypothetical protein ACR2GW_12750 [Pyrinomonadaceae bacterium]